MMTTTALLHPATPSVRTSHSLLAGRHASRCLLLCLALFAQITLLAQTASAQHKDAWPAQTAQVQLARDIVSVMQEQHFRRMTIDDKLSSALLDNYLDMLDGSRMIFLASDIAEFNRLRHQFDDDLHSGKLTSAREVYQRYHQRYSDRLTWVLKNIGRFLPDQTMNGSDSIEVERKDSPWPANATEADQLWEKNLRNAILSLKLADKPADNIATTLQRRYQAQLDRLNKQTAMDSFELFINAYTELYDPHTNYMSPQSAENFEISMALSLEGIGAELEREDEYTKIRRLIPAGPASRQGELKPGDLIIAVAQGQQSEEWQDVIGWRLDEVVEQIRGKADSWVRLQVRRNGDEIRNIAIRREKVKLEDQAASKDVIELKDQAGQTTQKIGVITVPNFYLDFEALKRGDPDTRSTTRDVMQLLDELKQEQVSGIVIDLRDNGGGSLREATQLTSLFIDQGPVVQILNTSRQVDNRNRATGNAYYRGPLLVLVNHFSASASEIFAGAIQDYHRGLVVGEQTFGKGTVQSLVSLYQGKLKITEAKFYRVSGDSTQHRGIIPDIQYPAQVAYDEVGESALEHALPWDRIQAAPYRKLGDLSALIPALRTTHETRMNSSPDYHAMLKRHDWVTELKNRKTLPLDLDARKNLKKQEENSLLAIINEPRKAKNQPPYASVEEFEKAQQQNREQKNHKDDFLLQESAKILSDYISLSQSDREKIAWQ